MFKYTQFWGNCNVFTIKAGFYTLSSFIEKGFSVAMCACREKNPKSTL